MSGCWMTEFEVIQLRSCCGSHQQNSVGWRQVCRWMGHLETRQKGTAWFISGRKASMGGKWWAKNWRENLKEVSNSVKDISEVHWIWQLGVQQWILGSSMSWCKQKPNYNGYKGAWQWLQTIIWRAFFIKWSKEIGWELNISVEFCFLKLEKTWVCYCLWGKN